MPTSDDGKLKTRKRGDVTDRSSSRQAGSNPIKSFLGAQLQITLGIVRFQVSELPHFALRNLDSTVESDRMSRLEVGKLVGGAFLGVDHDCKAGNQKWDEIPAGAPGVLTAP